MSDGITDICNEAIALLGAVANANLDALETYDGNPSDASSQPSMAWMQRLYPSARKYSQIKLGPPESLRYADPGSALSSTTANTNTGWEYVYSKPDGCIHFLGVVLKDVHDEQTGEDLVYPYRLIGNQIACDLATDILFKYLVEVVDTTEFSMGLRMVIVHRLAYLAARPVGGLTQESRIQLLTEFNEALADARSFTGQRVYRRPPQLTMNNAHYAKIPNQRVYEDSQGNLRSIG